MNIVYGKLAISLACTLLIIVMLVRRKAITAWLDGQSSKVVLTAGWLLFRLLPFVGVYLIAGLSTTSDVNGFWDEGSKASLGQIVYRDFWSPYSPLYAYFLGAFLKLWYDPKMIVLTMALMDGVALWLSFIFYRPLVTQGNLLFKAMVYLLFPGSLVLCIIGAQEDVWMWLFVVLAYLVQKRTGKVTWYAVILAIGLLTTKAIFVLILFPLFLIEKEKIRFLVPMAAIGLLSLAILYPLVGWEFMQPLDEAKTLRAPNIPAVINPWFANQIGVGEKFWNWIGLLLSLGLGSWTALRFQNKSFQYMLSRTWVVLFATMMIVQQSAYSNYIFLFLIPLMYGVVDWTSKKQVALLLIYNILCVVHPSIWWRLDMPKYHSLNDIVATQTSLMDYSLQLCIIVLTGYFIRLAFRESNVMVQQH
ncbi:hypothetical protein CLV98_111152 [Dyadobacter jejuensis]|uniref:Gpi18-like mannosyltransferase n=1 Tax=Dyadobacter jejuensis TaxID=1082580 RepID=A0A316AHA4_9BACT|nr:hypothetical protein [Dyadobacter jejuensis]PWJ56658.1 hypothetical protein CLV98_111152 [Dyadobacter jejuensis]